MVMFQQSEAAEQMPVQLCTGSSKSRGEGQVMRVPSESMVQRAIRAFNENSTSSPGASLKGDASSPLAGAAFIAQLCPYAQQFHFRPQRQIFLPLKYELWQLLREPAVAVAVQCSCAAVALRASVGPQWSLSE